MYCYFEVLMIFFLIIVFLKLLFCYFVVDWNVKFFNVENSIFGLKQKMYVEIYFVKNQIFCVFNIVCFCVYKVYFVIIIVLRDI